MQGENLQQVRLNRHVIQADATASPEGRGPGWAEAILHDPPIKKKRPQGAFFVSAALTHFEEAKHLKGLRLSLPAV